MFTKSDFKYDEQLKIYSARNMQEFSYKDGTENLILQKLRQAKDVSKHSPELRPWRSWSEEYHFSPYRANILEPIHQYLNENTRVLELGAGCGAITSALGEKGCIVDAVEGSTSRATIARERCRGYSTVSIYNENIENISFGKQYDIVTYIGVLEYSPVFFKSKNPFLDALNIAKAHLKDGGVLIIAIENKIGLKYISGYPEDHVGKSYFGLSSLYNNHEPTPETFTKKTLKKLLDNVELGHCLFYDAYPDYKLPEVILAEKIYDNPDFSLAQILTSNIHRHNGKKRLPAFFEAGFIQSLEEENLEKHFPSSYVAVASNKEILSPQWSAVKFSLSRKKEYCTQTLFHEDRQHSITVKKIATCKHKHHSTFVLNEFFEQYVPGESILFKGKKLLYANTANTWQQFEKLIIQYRDFLTSFKNNDGTLPTDFIDVLPSNIIENKKREWVIIDKEYTSKTPVHIEAVFYRGVLTFFSNMEIDYYIHNIQHKNICSYIYSFLDKDKTTAKQAFEMYLDLETKLSDNVRCAPLDIAKHKKANLCNLKFVKYKAKLTKHFYIVPWLYHRLIRK